VQAGPDCYRARARSPNRGLVKGLLEEEGPLVFQPPAKQCQNLAACFVLADRPTPRTHVGGLSCAHNHRQGFGRLVPAQQGQRRRWQDMGKSHGVGLRTCPKFGLVILRSFRRVRAADDKEGVQLDLPGATPRTSTRAQSWQPTKDRPRSIQLRLVALDDIEVPR